MTGQFHGKELRWTHFPYCLDRQPDGRYAVLNRSYKPVGMMVSNFVTYADNPVLVKIKGLTPLRASKMSYAGSTDLDRIYFYNDGCVPTSSAANMSAYLKRLAVLMKLTIDDA